MCTPLYLESLIWFACIICTKFCWACLKIVVELTFNYTSLTQQHGIFVTIMGVYPDGHECSFSCFCWNGRRLMSATSVAFCVCVFVHCCEVGVGVCMPVGGALDDRDYLLYTPSFYQCNPLPTECLIGLGYYAPNGTNSCRPCTVCNGNQGIRSPCTEMNDTLCEDCGEGTYSKITSSGRTCYPCTVCAQEGKREVSPCSATDDSICGECASGYFLYIDSRGSECKLCSQCPHDRVVIHWIECAEAHLPLDMQCAPGTVLC